MNRPLYETESDRVHEYDVMSDVYRKFGADEFLKLPMSYGFDFALYKQNQLKAVVEVKCRKQRYDTLILSLQKFMCGLGYLREGIPAFLVVVWDGHGTFVRRFREFDLKVLRIEFGGRSDRGDPDDQEPVVHIPIEEFREF